MKSTVITIALLSFFSCSAYEKATIKVAGILDYPLFVIDYHNKVDKLLSEISVTMMLRVQELEQKGQLHRANIIRTNYENQYARIKSEFDRQFASFDLELLQNAKRLDAEDQPEKIKTQFINQLKSKIKIKLDSQLKSYNEKIKIWQNY